MFPKTYVVPFLVVVLVIFFVGVWLFISNSSQQQNQNPNLPDSEVTSFEECVEAGYAVMESYPPRCRTETGETFTQEIGNELELSEEISIVNPRPNQTISSPLIIKGRARGTFYFEGSFPIRLVDENGVELAESYTEAQDEWMTEEFVPFIGELEFQTDASSGILYLEKANPSGLPENELILEVPVQF